MTEKQPPHSTEHNGSEDQEKFPNAWNSSELPANTPVTISAEHTTSDAPEIAAFHLGADTAKQAQQEAAHKAATAKLSTKEKK